MRRPLIMLITLLTFSTLFAGENPGWKKYFYKYNVDGSIVIYNLKKNRYDFYNKERCGKRFLPASTFKIFNSLTAIESGAIKDEREIIKWDSVDRGWDKWNSDQTIKTAYKYSVVWAYQIIARRIGSEQMQKYLNAGNYGNKTIGNKIDTFWLDNSLQISQMEQIDFLKRLYKEELPFSQRTFNIVKDVMIYEQKEDYTIRAKTGWGEVGKINYGWFVGWVEKGDDVYFFATNIESDSPKDSFKNARIDITKNVLGTFKIL